MDLIDRQDAIDAVRHAWAKGLEPTQFLEQLPSAQPERKKGKWIIECNPETGWYRVTCSECGEIVTSVIPMTGFFPNAKALWDFCPDCGADMRETK